MNIRKQTKKWQTKDGREIRICDMEDSHLINTIKLLNRTAELHRERTISFYLNCTPPTADIAEMAFEAEMDKVFNSTPENFLPPIFNNLMMEKERRGFKHYNIKERRKEMKRQFFIAGVQFRPRQEINQVIREMKVGDHLQLTPEPTNKFDPNAVKIEYNTVVVDEVVPIFLGYVPKKFSSEVSAMLDIGAPITCTVDEVNPSAKTYEMIKVTVAIPIDEEEEEEERDYVDEGGSVS